MLGHCWNKLPALLQARRWGAATAVSCSLMCTFLMKTISLPLGSKTWCVCSCHGSSNPTAVHHATLQRCGANTRASVEQTVDGALQAVGGNPQLRVRRASKRYRFTPPALPSSLRPSAYFTRPASLPSAGLRVEKKNTQFVFVHLGFTSVPTSPMVSKEWMLPPSASTGR